MLWLLKEEQEIDEERTFCLVFQFSTPAGLKLEHPLELPGRLVKQISGFSNPRISDSVLALSLRIHISSMFPGFKQKMTLQA